MLFPRVRASIPDPPENGFLATSLMRAGYAFDIATRRENTSSGRRPRARHAPPRRHACIGRRRQRHGSSITVKALSDLASTYVALNALDIYTTTTALKAAWTTATLVLARRL
jgi:hypothetical protein